VIVVISLAAGILLGLWVHPSVPPSLQPYLPMAIVAALDGLLGGGRARLEGTFSEKVFVVSLLSNTTLAALIVFIGDQLGVGGEMSTAVVVVLGMRIFQNLARIRRHVFRA